MTDSERISQRAVGALRTLNRYIHRITDDFGMDDPLDRCAFKSPVTIPRIEILFSGETGRDCFCLRGFPKPNSCFSVAVGPGTMEKRVDVEGSLKIAVRVRRCGRICRSFAVDALNFPHLDGVNAGENAEPLSAGGAIQ